MRGKVRQGCIKTGVVESSICLLRAKRGISIVNEFVFTDGIDEHC